MLFTQPIGIAMHSNHRLGTQTQKQGSTLVTRVCFHMSMSCQICAVPDLCCIVTRRLVESVGGVFDPVVSSAIAVFVVMAMPRVWFGCSSLSAWNPQWY